MYEIRRLVALGLLVVLSACASGPEFSEVKEKIPPVSEDQARVYFYRSQVFGAAVQPSIYINDQALGKCQPKGVFYRDFEPGNYTFWVETEVRRDSAITLRAGDERYMRCYISIGWIVGRAYLEEVQPAEAKAEIQALSFTQPVPKPSVQPSVSTEPTVKPNAEGAPPAKPTS